MSSKRVPKYLYYRGHWIPVVQMDASLMDNCLGQFSHERMEIWLLSGMKENVEEATFIHEMMEAINLLDYMKIDHDIITRLANAIYQVLKENDIYLYHKAER